MRIPNFYRLISSLFFLATVFAVSLPVFATDGASGEVAARVFLSRFPTLRVAMIESAGNGHQAFTIKVIRRIREIGYRGHIELYFDPSAKRKLELLLPPFRSDGDDHQILSSLDVETFPLNARPETQVALAILPAQVNNHFKPDKLNARHLLVIHPPNWTKIPVIRTTGDKIRLENVREHFPARLSFAMPGSIPDFLTSQLENAPRLAAKIDGLSELLTLKENRKLDLLSAYGLGFNGVDKLVTLTRALSLARHRAPSKFRQPIVIGMISNLNHLEWKSVTAGWRENSSDFVRAPRILDVTDDDFTTQIKRLNPDDIAVVKIGDVTQEVWNLLMTASSLPPLAGGSNGSDFLLQKGKPFIMTIPDTVEFDWDAKAARRLKAMIEGTSTALADDDVETVARFLIGSRSFFSLVPSTFRGHAERLSRLPDRVCESLVQVRDIWDQLNE